MANTFQKPSLMDNGSLGPPWFAPKRFGLGSSLPIRWQGWATLAIFVVAVGGDMLFAPLAVRGATSIAAIAAVTLVSALKTRGGWRWRWGERD